MGKRRILALGAFSVLLSGLAIPRSQAIVGQVGVGAGYPVPLTSAQLTLNRAVSFEGELLLDDFSWAPGLRPKVTAFYLPETVRNLTGGLLHIGGATIGLQTQGGGFWMLSPFFSLGVGGAFESLQFANAASPFANTALVFLGQAEGGMDIGLFSKFGVILKAPVQVLLTRPLYLQWSGIALLRWRFG